MHFLAQCGSTGMWPKREGEVWWSICPNAPLTGLQPRTPGPITEQQLQDWIQDTVGWASLEISAEAFLAAGSHPSQVKPLVQAAFEAAARLNTPKCRFKQVDIDLQMAKCISMALRAYPNFRTLVLLELNVYEEAVMQLAKGLGESESLVKLVLSTCDMSTAGWEAVMHAVATSHSLRQLKIRGGLSRLALGSVCTAVRQSQTLQALDLSSNPLSDTGLSKLCDAMAASTSIKIVKLEKCNVGRQGVSSLVRLVRDSHSLTCLHMAHNDLGEKGCSDLAKAVGSCHTLQQLWASHTGFDDAAVQHLAASLTTCTSLHTLDLSYCKITDKGSHILSAAAMKLPLVCVRLSGNTNLGTPGLETWFEVLSLPRRPLTVLALSDCEAGDAAAYKLAAAIRHTAETNSLEQLEVAGNHFTYKGVSALVNAAACSHSLRCLDVSLNWLGPRAMAACIRSMESARATAAQQLALQSVKAARKVAAGSHLLMPAHMCEVKSEVLPEFREIERVKYSDWSQLDETLQAQIREQQLAETAGLYDSTDSPTDNPFLNPPPGPQQVECTPGSTSAPGLRPGRQIPAGLGAAASEDDSPCAGESGGDSNRTHASSRMTSKGGLLGHSGSSASSHRQEGFGGGWGGGADGAQSTLDHQLQGMSDGTINHQLPVSFSAQERLDSGDAPPLRQTGSMPGSTTIPPASQPFTATGQHPLPAGPPSLLTAASLHQLHQAYSPLQPGELLLLAHRRHGVTHAVPHTPGQSNPHQPPAPHIMAAPPVHTAARDTRSPDVSAPQLATQITPDASPTCDLSNPFASASTTAPSGLHQHNVGPAQPDTHMSAPLLDNPFKAETGEQNPFASTDALPNADSNPFRTSTSQSPEPRLQSQLSTSAPAAQGQQQQPPTLEDDAGNSGNPFMSPQVWARPRPTTLDGTQAAGACAENPFR